MRRGMWPARGVLHGDDGDTLLLYRGPLAWLGGGRLPFPGWIQKSWRAVSILAWLGCLPSWFWVGDQPRGCRFLLTPYGCWDSETGKVGEERGLAVELLRVRRLNWWLMEELHSPSAPCVACGLRWHEGCTH